MHATYPQAVAVYLFAWFLLLASCFVWGWAVRLCWRDAVRMRKGRWD